MLMNLQKLFPAHAGVILQRVGLSVILLSFPCTRRGDPFSAFFVNVLFVFSLHTQG